MAYEQQNAQKSRADNVGAATSLKEDFVKMGKISQKLVDDSLEGVRENLSGYYNKGQEKLTDMEKKFEGAIRKYPLRALLAAAGAGFLIGFIRRKI
jgi:hypothetical protein